MCDVPLTIQKLQVTGGRACLTTCGGGLRRRGDFSRTVTQIFTNSNNLHRVLLGKQFKQLDAC
jgi:hypothetical protein